MNSCSPVHAVTLANQDSVHVPSACGCNSSHTQSRMAFMSQVHACNTAHAYSCLLRCLTKSQCFQLFVALYAQVLGSVSSPIAKDVETVVDCIRAADLV